MAPGVGGREGMTRPGDFGHPEKGAAVIKQRLEGNKVDAE